VRLATMALFGLLGLACAGHWARAQAISPEAASGSRATLRIDIEGGEARAVVAENGAVQATMIIAVEPEWAGMVREYLRRHFPGWGISESVGEEQVEFVCRRVLGSNETLAGAQPPDRASGDTVRVAIERRGLMWEYRFSHLGMPPGAGEGDLAQPSAARIPATYSVTMPGRITEAAGATLEGNTATWDFTLGDHPLEVSATSRLSQVPRLLVLLGCVAALLAGYVFLARARR